VERFRGASHDFPNTVPTQVPMPLCRHPLFDNMALPEEGALSNAVMVALADRRRRVTAARSRCRRLSGTLLVYFSYRLRMLIWLSSSR